MTTTNLRLPRLADLSLAEVEGIRLLLRGGSVIDWHRLNFADAIEIERFIQAQELDLESEVDCRRIDEVRDAAIDFLKAQFNFPVPKPVARKSLPELLELASSKGHRQLCACAILKVMHIIHHLEARELLFSLPVSDEDVFHLVENKVYRLMGEALSSGVPVVEFIGGRKNKTSLYTKLLSKTEATAAQIYDKVRFRIVMRTVDDIFPMLTLLQRRVFPFSFVIPGQSTNTLIPFYRYCSERKSLRNHLASLQLPFDIEDEFSSIDNRFTAPSYRVVHFVVDMPLRIPESWRASAPDVVDRLGHVVFVQTEFQVLDEISDRQNEESEASHSAYKDRQKLAVARRLKVGLGNRS
ncbi:MAG: TIGR04552 family protein [Polyangiales bacterium]